MYQLNRAGLGRATLRLAPLLLILGLVLFPFGWLGAHSVRFERALGRVFADEPRHAIGHATLFLLLGLAALRVFPSLCERPWRYFGLLWPAGVGQELLQLLVKQRPPLLDDGRDLLVDLLGLALAFGVMWLLRQPSVR